MHDCRVQVERPMASMKVQSTLNGLQFVFSKLNLPDQKSLTSNPGFNNE
jgi:hypothetical protein